MFQESDHPRIFRKKHLTIFFFISHKAILLQVGYCFISMIPNGNSDYLISQKENHALFSTLY